MYTYAYIYIHIHTQEIHACVISGLAWLAGTIESTDASVRAFMRAPALAGPPRLGPRTIDVCEIGLESLARIGEEIGACIGPESTKIGD